MLVDNTGVLPVDLFEFEYFPPRLDHTQRTEVMEGLWKIEGIFRCPQQLSPCAADVKALIELHHDSSMIP